MKLKESRLCCAFAWNPRDAQSSNLLLAAGSIAGAMDDNFSSEAHLEIRKVDLTNTTSNDLPVVGRVVMPDRAHRIHWSSHGCTNGMIAAGLVDGTVKVWSADKMLENYDATADPTPANDYNDDPFGTNSPPAAAAPAAGRSASAGGNADPEASTLCTISAHQGGVRGIQFNPIRPDLLATGGADRELCIWSLTNPLEPLKVPSPPKSTHMGEITDVRWNVRFEHIIGTTTTAGTFSLWDLRNLRQTQQISGQQGSATTLAWHPEGLTQVAIARDGTNPVVQIWDLKKANAPVKELRGHNNGVVGLSWCHDDSNLLFSAGCDGRTICWNPNSGELVGELAPQNNWVTDVAWCPRVPAIVATSSFDSTLAVHAAQDVSGTSATGTATLPKAVPKWLNRPCSAAYGFGGRIVRLSKKAADGTNTPNTTLTVITKAPEVTEEDATFRAELATSATNPEWITAKGFADIAAVATSNAAGNREAVLTFLGVDPNAVTEELNAAPEGADADPATIETLIARCVASGKLTQAVDLCINTRRFDDAFAIAYLRGTDEVTRVHQAFVAHKSAKGQRFATYIGAVASKNIDSLKAAIGNKSVDWREALAVLTTFLPPQNFAAAATSIGELLESSDPNGAASCYICAGAIDNAARLWSRQKPIDQFVHTTQILEAVIKTQCREKTFIDALATYADQLAKGGDYKGALQYAARAAQMGSEEAAVVADLCQSMVAPADRLNVKFPFTPIQIPDSTNPIVQQLAAMQQPVVRHVDPVPQKQQQMMMGGGQQQMMMGGGQQQMMMGGGGGGGGMPRPAINNGGMMPPQHPSMPMAAAAGGAAGMMNRPMQPPMGGAVPPSNGGYQPSQYAPSNNNGGMMPPPQQQQFGNNNNGMMAPPMTGGPNNNMGAMPRSATPSAPGMPPMPMPGQQQPPMMGGGMMPPPPNGANNNNGMMNRPPMPMAGQQPPMMGGALTNNGMMPQPNFGGAPANNAMMPPPPAAGGMPPPPMANRPPPPAAGGMPPMQQPTSPTMLPPPPSAGGVAPPPPTNTNMMAPPPQQQQPTPSMMTSPMGLSNSNPAAAPNMMAPPNAAPAQQQQPPMGAPLMGAPTPMAAATAAAPPMMARPPTSSLVAANYGGPAAAGAAGFSNSSSSAVVFTYDTNTIADAEGRNIATVIVDATNKIKDKRKRESIEKAALELFGRLGRGEVSAPCVQLLSAYVAALGTPAAKDTWRKLSDAHFGEIGPYLNLKFL